MRATASPASLDYPLLFASPRGPHLRWIARLTLALALGLTLAVISLALGLRTRGSDLPPPVWIGSLLLLGLVWTAAGSSVRRARQGVIRLQLWPRSHLFVVHTPGLWTGRVALFPVTEIGGPARAGALPPDLFLPAGGGRGGVRIRLQGGGTLLFDPIGAEYPCGRPALVAFLGQGTFPEAAAGPVSAVSARGRDGREAPGPKFPVDRVVGALESANLEAARLDILESVVERRQQQRIGKFNP